MNSPLFRLATDLTRAHADQVLLLDNLKRDRANLELLLEEIDAVTPETLVELKITARVIRRKMNEVPA